MPHTFEVITELGDGFKFDSYDGKEELSRMSDGTLICASLDNAIPLNALLGKSVTIAIELQDKSKRYYNANVSEFKQIKRHGRYYRYELRLRPKVWFLSLTNDFRIYQKMSALDIVKSIYSEFGILIKDKTTASYPSLDYTVLYNESYLDFCMRLQEKEGIGFYFEHANGIHTLVLFDSVNVLSPLPSHATIPYYPVGMMSAIPDEECVSALHAGQTAVCGKFAMTEYNFKGPKAYLDVDQPNPRSHELNRHEVYDYPGVYRDLGQGEAYGRIGIEALQAHYERCDGETNVRGFAVGYLFGLTKCPRKDQNREYLIEAVHHHWTGNSYESGAGSQVVEHVTQFTIRPSSEPYRPQRITPHPQAYATELAVVTGPAGQEIWTDTHGRVKLHFLWDRRGPKDQNSSCWARVATTHAGNSFGAVSIPRIGESVLVSYVNGNPDHPLVTGRVYNGDNMPPWGLPANATQSGILTRSTKGGGYSHANAIRFEDKKGEEQLWFHAEKDQLTEVEHDEDKTVGNDRRKTIHRDETNHIKRDRIETVNRDETITVNRNRKEEVDGTESITIHRSRDERVDLNEQISIGQNRDEDVGASESVKIADNRDCSIGNNRSDKIGAKWSVRVATFKMETIGMTCMQNVAMMKMSNTGMIRSTNTGVTHNDLVGVSSSAQVGKTKSVTVGDTYAIRAKVVLIEASEMLMLSSGGSQYTLTPAGTFEKAVEINVHGQDALNAEAQQVNINTGAAKDAPKAPAPKGDAGEGAGDAGAGAPSGAPGGGPGGLAGALGSLGAVAGAVGKIAGAVQGAKAGGLAGAIGGLAGAAGGSKGGAPAVGATPGWGGPISM